MTDPWYTERATQAMSETPFFDLLLKRAKLPRVVSQASLERALARAGLTPETVSPLNLRGALDAIVLTMSVYHDEQELPALVDQLKELCEEEP